MSFDSKINPERENSSEKRIILENGITSEVSTIISQITVKDLLERIIEKKCRAVSNWVNSLDADIGKTVIVGAYLTGIGLSMMLKKTSDVTVVDIHPHLGNLVEMDVKFASKISVIKDADLVIDTTGLGGLTPEMARNIQGKIFLVEDPTSDGSDVMIEAKSNIQDRLKRANTRHKGILKTQGLKSKTSGTMTLNVEIIRKSLEDALRKPGVLYGVAGMEFYEGILFKEKNVNKFLDLTKKSALTISTLEPFSCDDIILGHLDRLDSWVEDVRI
jgi:hypothetical protein